MEAATGGGARSRAAQAVWRAPAAQGRTMDWTALRNWPKGVGAALALLLLLSLLSFDLQDPTLTNLRQPSGGIANWIGLPGALLGGSLLELLGTAALAAPLLLLNWTLCARGRPASYAYALWSACVLLALAGLHGLAGPHGPDGPAGDPGLLVPGLAGWSVRRWAELTTGPWPAAALLAYLGGYAGVRTLYAPVLRAAARDARLFATWFLREGWRQGSAGWLALRLRAGRLQRVSGGAALGLTRRTRGGLREAVRLALRLPRIALAWLAELRSPSLARIKLRSAGRGGDPLQRRADGRLAGAAAGGPGPAAEPDGFASWFEQAEPDASAAPAGARSTQAATSAATPAAPRLATSPLLAAPLRPPPGAAWAEALRAAERDDEAFAGGAAAAQAASTQAAAAQAASADAAAAAPPQVGETDYGFERPEAEAAWRERFQRYARNLDLDWEEQLWRRKEQAAPDEDEEATDAE
jgi:hypothetical protein